MTMTVVLLVWQGPLGWGDLQSRGILYAVRGGGDPNARTANQEDRTRVSSFTVPGSGLKRDGRATVPDSRVISCY